MDMCPPKIEKKTLLDMHVFLKCKDDQILKYVPFKFPKLLSWFSLAQK